MSKSSKTSNNQKITLNVEIKNINEETKKAEKLIELLKDFAKWGCLGMGLKKLVEEMLSGANFKQASVAGMQYWLCYIFIQFYPKLFDMIKM